MMIRLFFTITLFLFPSATVFGFEITFSENVTVDGTVVTVGDVAKFHKDSAFARALSTQTISQAPPPGESISLSSISLKKKLLAKITFPRDTRWKGPPVISITRNAITVGPEQISTYIGDFLEANKPDLPEAEIRFVPKALPMPFHLPVGDLSCEVIPSNPSILGSSRFALIFRVDGKVAKNMSVRGKIIALADIVITTKNIKRGEILTPSHLTTALRDINKIDTPSMDINEFIGMRAKRRLRQGSPMQTSYIEPLPIVRKGQKVKIVVLSGQMLLTATGLAHNDGAKDQIIKVQNLNSHKVIFCRVAAPGLVEVLL